MDEEKKQQLDSLLRAAIENIQLSTSYPAERLLPIEEYRMLYLQNKNDFSNAWYRNRIKLVISNNSVENDVLNFMRHELAEYLYKDKIQCATVATTGGLTPTPLDKLLEDILRISIVFGIENSVFIFEKLLVKKHIDYQEISLLSGIKIDNEMQIYDGFKLIPLPSSSGALSQMEILSGMGLGIQEKSNHFTGRTLAVIDCTREPIFANPKSRPMKEGPFDVFRRHTKNIELEDFKIQEFLWGLSLCCKHPINEVMWWDHINQWEPLVDHGVSSCSYSHDLYRSNRYCKISENDIADAKKYYKKFKDLPAQVKEKLRIAIPRWLKSKNEGWVDQIIDLGIAFEAIYLDETKEQLSYTFRTRAAWYLGEDLSERQRYRDLFKKFYNYRSNAVHTGRIASAKKTRDANESKKIRSLLNDADKLCVASIIKVINDGGFPDWETLVLGR